ncbi:hypothetical protein [Streptomyces sp. DH8]|uniref:hypothetical protein n=1 Tax=Streptomyces sp. DH8 TaxID=2857008 RepID=UPI001E3577A6|nr:hypothetical protein [Streptomyces sp. DH8]
MTTSATTKSARAAKRRRALQPTVPGPGREPTQRIRWALYNGAAAGAGLLTVWALTGDPLAGVDLMARMTISVPQLAAAGLAVTAAYAGWKGAVLIRLHRLPGIFGLAARPVAALVAALWGQGTAPLVADLLDAIEPWGTALSPLLAAGPVAAACWYGLDRPAAAASLVPPVRWALRIPLATVVVSSLIYGPGAVL